MMNLTTLVGIATPLIFGHYNTIAADFGVWGVNFSFVTINTACRYDG